MNNDNGKINVKLELDNSELKKNFNESKQTLNQFSSSVQKESNAMENALKRVGTAVGGIFAVSQLKAFANQVINVRSEIQALSKSFETLAGKEAGGKLFEQIKDFAVHTPLQMKDLAKGAQTLLSFNIEAEKVMPILKSIGDISMGDANKLNSLTLAFAQMTSTGKLAGNDWLQMVNAGFNPLQEIAEKTGKSVSQLKDEMSKGKISVEMVTDAFMRATSEGGKFNGMLEAQSKTLNGQLSNLRGALDDMFNEIGEKSEGIISGAISSVDWLVKHYEEVGKILLSLIATYGAYRTAVMFAVEAEKGYTAVQVLKYKWLVLVEKAQKLLNATQLANPAVALATALTAVVTALILYSKHANKTSEYQEKVNDSIHQFNTQIQTEQKRLDTLFEPLLKAKKGTEEWEKAKKALIKQFGSYHDGLDKELEKTDDLRVIYDKLTSAIRENVKARMAASAYEDLYQKQAEDEAEVFDKVYERLAKNIKDKNKLNKAYNEIVNYANGVSGAISASTRDAMRGNVLGTDNLSLAMQDLIKIRQGVKEAEEKYKTLYGEQIIKTTTTAENEEKGTDNNTATDEQKKLQEALNERKRAISQYYEDVINLVANYNKELTATEISSLNDGYEKTLKEIEHKYSDLYDANEQREKEMIDALKDKMVLEWLNANPKATKEQSLQYRDSLNLGRGDLSKEQQGVLLAFERQAGKEREKLLKEINDKEINALYDFLAKYGTYEQQKLAITKEYEEKIKNATTEGLKQSLIAEQQERLKEIDQVISKENINWERIFGDVSNYSEKALKEIKKQIEDIIATDQTLSATDKSSLIEQYNTINDRLNTMNKTWKDYLGLTTEYSKTIDRLKEELELREKNRDVIKEQYDLSKKKADEDKNAFQNFLTTNGLGTIGNIDSSKLNAGNIEQYNTLSGAYMQSSNKLKELTKSLKKANQELDNAQEKVDNFKSSPEEFAKLCSDIRDDIINVLSAISDGIDTLGLGDTATGKAIKGVSGGFSGLANSFASFASGNYIGAITSAVSSFASFAQMLSNDEYRAKVIETIKHEGEVLRESIDMIIDEMSDGTFSEKSNEYLKALNQYLSRMQDLQNNMTSLGSKHVSGWDRLIGKHSTNYYINKALENGGYGQVSQLLGKEIDSVNDLLNLSSKEWATIKKELPELYDDIIGRASEGAYDISALIEEFTEIGEEIEELENQWRESITQISFDSLKDDFVSTLMDMSSSAEDFSNSFAKNLQQSIIKSKIAESLEDELQEFYSKWADMSASDGELTADEINQLKNTWETLTNKGLALRDEIAKITGYDDTSSRSGSSKGITTASQETIDELNGRATAIQSHTYSINENSKILVSTSNQILRSVINIESYVSDMSKDVTNVKKDLQNVRTGVSVMTDKGIRLK